VARKFQEVFFHIIVLKGAYRVRAFYGNYYGEYESIKKELM